LNEYLLYTIHPFNKYVLYISVLSTALDAEERPANRSAKSILCRSVHSSVGRQIINHEIIRRVINGQIENSSIVKWGREFGGLGEWRGHEGLWCMPI
jgi:hypothetical protein